jgi:Bifunctional DNA primase/polymerase, N-terminal
VISPGAGPVYDHRARHPRTDRDDDMSEPDPTTGDTADAATVYAEAGWRLIPLHWPLGVDVCSCRLRARCPSAGKHPLLEHGVHDATDDADQIAEWWQRWPRANIGAAIPPRLCVVDVDPRNGGDPTWEQLCRRRLVYTLMTLSGRGDGGRHYWFRKPDGPIRSSLGAGVDVKKHGGFVILPPSVHAATLDPYRWANEATPIATPPGWLAELLRPPRAVRHPEPSKPTTPAGPWNPGGILHAMVNAAEGQRNTTLYWAACRIIDDARNGKATGAQMAEALDMLADAAIDRGLDRREVAGTITSAQRRAS